MQTAASHEGLSATKRETPREGDNPHPRPPFTPSRGLLDGHEKLVRQKNITIGILLAGLFLVAITVLMANMEQKVTIVDPVGGVTQGPLEPLATSKGYFGITSINAIQAALQRSSVGFDLQEMLAVYFSSNARRKLDADLESRREEMRRRRLSFKPVIESITPPQAANDGRVVRVTGRLQATGVVNSRLFYEETPYVVIFVFRSNPDLGNKAAMPWVVDEVDLAIGEAEIEKFKAKSKKAD